MRHISILCLFIVSCTTPDRVVLDSGLDLGVDASCTANLQEDIYNCGTCGYTCDLNNADRCESGACLCGSRSPCLDNEDCRNGVCIPKDPTGTVCEFDDACLAGFACIESRCSFVGCVPEVCDGYDNDCDGFVDNVGDAPLSQWCLGDREAPSTLRPPCAVGVRVCDRGSWGPCLGDSPPRPEVGLLACDRVDNDCDGCIDGTTDPVTGSCILNGTNKFDVVFAIDVSGSMAGSIAIVSRSVSLFSGRLDSDYIKYAVVSIPGPDMDSYPLIIQDLDTLATLQVTLDNITLDGGNEPQIDTIHQLGTGDLSLRWREDATRILILFTDEEGHSYTTPATTEAQMCDALTHGEVYILVTKPAFVGTMNGTPGFECTYSEVDLPQGTAGSETPCLTASDCLEDEVCLESICVSTTVEETVFALERSISNPCE